MTSLRASVVPASSLSTAQFDCMWNLFCQYYDKVCRPQFHADLRAKDDVILLLHENDIVGFSTLKKVRIDTEFGTQYGVFSGDTVLQRRFWGSSTLGRAFLGYMLRAQLRHPWTPLWWFLISKGYKTYLLMANNFQEHYPNAHMATPRREQTILDTFGTRYFGESYNARTNLIAFSSSRGQLKPGVADISPALLSHHAVTYFAERNPDWASGQELACLARMRWTMPLFYALKKRVARTLLGRSIVAHVGK